MKDLLTAEEIFNKIAQKYKGQVNKTQVSIVERENSKVKSSYKRVREKKARAKTLWILVETNEIRTEIREEVFKMFDRIEYKDSVGSSIAHLKITQFKKEDGIEEVRIMFKPFLNFNARKYKWENLTLKQLESSNKIKLNKPDNQDEAEVLKKINRSIEDNGRCVHLKIKNKTYKNVIGLNAGKSGRYATKADFIIINKDGEEIGWISYKAGRMSKDFQQYSGLTPDAGDEIYNHPQVKEFREKIVNDQKIQNSIKNDKKFAFIRIKGGSSARLLKNRAVFGKKYGRQKEENNVDWFAQGTPTLREVGKQNMIVILQLTFSTKLIENGKVNQLNKDYDPVIGARKGEANRRIVTDRKEAKGIRGGIFSQGLIEIRNSIDMSDF